MSRKFAYLPLLAAAACGRCGSKPAVHLEVEDLVPLKCDAAVFLPSIEETAEAAHALAAEIGRFPEGEVASQALGALNAQLGLDPRDRKALAAAGIAGDRKAALVQEGGDRWAALPVSDRGRFVQTVARLAEARLGAAKRERQGEVTVFSGPQGPAAAVAFVGDNAVVTSGPRAAALAAAALGRKKEERLGEDPIYRRAALKGGGSWDAVAYVPSTSALWQRGWFGRAALAGVSFRSGRLHAHLELMLSVAEGIGLAGFAVPAGEPLVVLLPQGDDLFVRAGGDPRQWFDAARVVLPAAVKQALAAAKIDVGRDVLGNLQPGLTLGMGLSPHLDLAAVTSFDPRQSNPFGWVILDGFAKVRDAKAAQQTLARLDALPADLGVKVRRRRVGGTEVQTFEYALGEGVSVALSGDTLVVTGGPGEMEGALARVEKKAPGYVPPPWLRRPLVGRVSSGLALDTDALRGAIVALPAASYRGLTGITLRALVTSWAAPLSLVGPLTATVDVAADAVEADADLLLR